MVSTSTSLACCIHETSWSLCNVRSKVEIAFRSIRRTSEPGRLVYYITQRVPSREGAAIVHHNLKPPFIKVWPVPGHMRRQQHVRQRPQRVLARERLLFVDI